MQLTAHERAFVHWRFAQTSAALGEAPEYTFDEALAAFESQGYVPRTETVVAGRSCAPVSHRDALRRSRNSWRAVFMLRNIAC